MSETRSVVVDFPGIKLCWFEIIRTMNEDDTNTATTVSQMSDNVQSGETDVQFDTASRAPILCTDITTAFHAAGNVPVLKELLEITHNGRNKFTVRFHQNHRLIVRKCEDFWVRAFFRALRQVPSQ